MRTRWWNRFRAAFRCLCGEGVMFRVAVDGENIVPLDHDGPIVNIIECRARPGAAAMFGDAVAFKVHPGDPS